MSSREAAANQSDDLRAVGVSREAGAGGTILKVRCFSKKGITHGCIRDFTSNVLTGHNIQIGILLNIFLSF